MAGNPIRRQQVAELEARIDELCDLLAGGASDKQAMKELGFPSAHPLYVLAKRNEEVSQRLVRAREVGAAAMASDTIDLADELVLLPKADPVQVAKLQIEARRWLAGKNNARYDTQRAGVAVQVNVGALHLQALKAVAAPVQQEALPVLDAEYAEVGMDGEALTLDDLL